MLVNILKMVFLTLAACCTNNADQASQRLEIWMRISQIMYKKSEKSHYLIHLRPLMQIQSLPIQIQSLPVKDATWVLGYFSGSLRRESDPF
jgi:hypothetical protein